MSFRVGDIPFFQEYSFTDTGKLAKHFGLVLLPETATKYENSLLCCVITSREPKRWGLLFMPKHYPCFSCDSYACFDRKDLVSKEGLGKDPQPRGRLNATDFREAFKILRKSLFVVKDLANDPYLRGAIIHEWKQAIKSF